jgi:short-subunit dehydrogenase
LNDLNRFWSQRVALITGASGGIGAATAQRLAAEGLRVALTGRRTERLDEIAARIRERGGEALVIPADLAQEAERVRLVEAVRAAWGPADVLINNAGFGWYGFGAEMPWPTARQMLETDLAAVVHLTLLCLPEMRARGCGHVVNVGSIAGDIPGQGTALYSALKGAVADFTTGLYRELKGTGVHVSVVKPGPVATGFFAVTAGQPGGRRMPAERFAIAPQRVADCIWGLLRRPRRVVYVPAVVRVAAWIEFYFGWAQDLLGPVLLRS